MLALYTCSQERTLASWLAMRLAAAEVCLELHHRVAALG